MLGSAPLEVLIKWIDTGNSARFGVAQSGQAWEREVELAELAFRQCTSGRDIMLQRGTAELPFIVG